MRSKSPLTASPASPGPLSNSLHGSFHGSLGSDGMSCSSARSSSASPDSARYSSTPVNIFFYDRSYYDWNFASKEFSVI